MSLGRQDPEHAIDFLIIHWYGVRSGSEKKGLCPEKHEALLKLGGRPSELGWWSLLVPGGRDCLWRDSRQLGGVAGGSTRSPVETLDRTTRKKIVRLRDLMTWARGSYLYFAVDFTAICFTVVLVGVRLSVEPCGYVDTWVHRYMWRVAGTTAPPSCKWLTCGRWCYCTVVGGWLDWFVVAQGTPRERADHLPELSSRARVHPSQLPSCPSSG